MFGHVAGTEVEFAQQQLEHLLTDPGLHLHTHGAPEPAATQLHLHRRQQVVRVFVLQREVDVAGDPEDGVLLDHHADEQTVQLSGDQLFCRQEANPVG